jgi:hypothetical protein
MMLIFHESYSKNLKYSSCLIKFFLISINFPEAKIHSNNDPLRCYRLRLGIFRHLIIYFIFLCCQNITAEPYSEEGDEDSMEDDKKKKKKKREAPKKSEGVKEGDKKESDSFKWSSIFGLDRKKKSTGLVFHPLEVDDRRRKRCEEGNCDEEDDYS